MPKWTPDQQTAIDDRGGALLVSAAAGSGKTAVLTERVLRRLTDEKDPGRYRPPTAGYVYQRGGSRNA